MTTPHSVERLVPVTELGERLASLRLADAAALRGMRASLAQHGQLSPVRAFEHAGALEVLDGFKRLHAARCLGLRQLHALVVEVDVVEATVHMRELHSGCGLTALEEAWIVRALHRDHDLSQGAIAARLRCHKSWVCRRLMLVEALDTSVQADVRLGLLAPRAAVHVAALPRGNQELAARTAIARGLTVRQTARFVQELTDVADDDTLRAVVARWSAAPATAPRSGARTCRSVLETIALDINTLQKTAGRLQSCLVTTPLAAFETAASNIVRESLGELANTLRALSATIDRAISTGTQSAAVVA